MRSYNKVSPRFWTSATVRSLSEDGRNLFLYLITCPHNSILGCLYVPMGYMIADLKWSEQRLRKGLLELVEVEKPSGSKGVIIHDEPKEMIFIRSHFKHNPIQNENQAKAGLKYLATLPDSFKCFSGLKSRLITVDKPHLDPLIKGLDNRLTKGIANTDTEQEQKQEGESSQGSDFCPEPAAAGPVQPERKVVAEVPQLGGKTYEVTEEQRDKWQAAYPAVDVDGQILRAVAWLDSNPKNQKSNVPRFLNNWLKREQDKAPSRAGPGRRCGAGAGRTPGAEERYAGL